MAGVSFGAAKGNRSGGFADFVRKRHRLYDQMIIACFFIYAFRHGEGDVLGAFNTICRCVFSRRSIRRETSVLRLAGGGGRIRPCSDERIGAGAATARAVPGLQVPALGRKRQLVHGRCRRHLPARVCRSRSRAAAERPSQTFGYENGANLTLGGLCLDAQPSAAGSPVVIAECDGSDHQVWVLQPFQSNNNVFLIGTSEGLCVSVNGVIGQRMPLLLAACEENPAQGWVFYTRPTPARPVYGTYSEPQYYWRGGERYCWYDSGWNGAGWYVCGRYTVRVRAMADRWAGATGISPARPSRRPSARPCGQRCGRPWC